MAVQYLKERAVIAIGGEDAEQFLQGLISNDITKAGAEQWLYALMLTPQGKLLWDMFITIADNRYLVDVSRAQLAEALKKFKMYKLRAKVAIEDISADYMVVVSPDTVMGLMIDPRKSELGYRGVVATNAAIAEAGSEYHLQRIMLKVVDMDCDLSPATFFPLELGMNELHAIDYNKGCYVGQEVTARTHHRGVVRKEVISVDLADESTIPERGSALEFEGRRATALGFIGHKGLLLARKME
jgi:tRNA-modifying protein YgfZ